MFLTWFTYVLTVICQGRAPFLEMSPHQSLSLSSIEKIIQTETFQR